MQNYFVVSLLVKQLVLQGFEIELREQLHKSFGTAVTTCECWAPYVCGAPEETTPTDSSEWQMWAVWPPRRGESRRVACSAVGTDHSYVMSVHMFLSAE